MVLLSRVTTIPLIFIFLAPIIYATDYVAIRKNLIIQLAGFAFSAGTFLLLLNHAGSLEAFVSYRNPTGGHSFGDLFNTIFEQIRLYAGQQIIGILCLIPLLLAAAFYIRQRLLFLLVLFVCIALGAPYLYWSHPLMGRTFPIILGTAITICTFWLQPKFRQGRHPFLFVPLILAALILPGAQGGGSDAGLIRFASGGWLLVPLSIILLMNAAPPHKAFVRNNLYALAITATLVYFASGFQTFHRYPYGDNNSRHAMTATFATPQLKGIHSTPGRVRSFDGLIHAISLHQPSHSDRLLAYNNLPMVFYASRTYPLFDQTWITCLSEAMIREIARDVCTSPDNTPGLIVRTKVEVRNTTWGENPEDHVIPDDILSAKSKMEILDKGIRKCRATLVWENHDFQLLKPAPSRQPKSPGKP